MEEQTLELLLGLASAVATLGIAWLKQTMNKKGISEDQADMVMDFAEDGLAELMVAYPDDKRVAEIAKQLEKLRRMWDRESVTSEDILEYLDDVDG